MTCTLHDAPSASAIQNASTPTIALRRVSDDGGWRQARALIDEYLAWASDATGLDPYTVQPWLRDELPNLGTWYTPPRGTLLLATMDNLPAGVVCVQAQPERWAELKRLYVTPVARGHRLGEKLVVEAMFAAADLGCETLRLESMVGLMDHAIALYRRLGFRPTTPIGHTTLDTIVSLERPVGRAAEPLATRDPLPSDRTIPEES